MRPFEETGWNRDHYYYVYRRVYNHRLELFYVTIDGISDQKIYMTAGLQEGVSITRSYLAKTYTIRTEEFNDYKFWIPIDSDTYEIFQLEVDELMNFI